MRSFYLPLRRFGYFDIRVFEPLQYSTIRPVKVLLRPAQFPHVASSFTWPLTPIRYAELDSLAQILADRRFGRSTAACVACGASPEHPPAGVPTSVLFSTTDTDYTCPRPQRVPACEPYCAHGAHRADAAAA
jgi:hypothetical protein